MSEPPEIDQPFCFNARVAIIIAVVLVAMALPVALVVIFVQKSKAEASFPPVEAATEPLRATLEKAIENTWAADTFEVGESEVIEIHEAPATAQAAGQRLEQLSARLGGAAILLEDGEALRRWRVTLPTKNLSTFRNGLLGLPTEAIDASQNASSDDALIEVRMLIASNEQR